MANNIAGVKRIFPLHRVASQLNVLTADGTAMISVVIIKTPPSQGFIPVTNMWCPQTMNDNVVIPISEYTMAW
ncbi:hypothetical protein D9M68_999210 [compost metagenome]